MNGEAYSSYPSEGEILLIESCPVVILAFDASVNIKNKHQSLKDYYDKDVMVFYLFLRN